MDDIEILLALLAVAAAAVWLARALHIPYPFLLVLAGIGVGYLPGVSEIEVEPDVIFLVFLPPLLHAAGWLSSPRHLRTYATGVTLLAGVLVLLTTGAVAVVAHAVIPGLSWGAAFVLGAIVSATDTVAATAVFRRLGVPERVVALVEGESLVNDGTALVLDRTAVPAAVAGAFSLGDAAYDLLLVGTGGAAVGLAIGWLVRPLRNRVDDDLIEITVTLLTAYLAFIGAEELGVSGVLAAVVSGLYLGARASQDFSAGTRLKAYSFWEVLVFLLESVLFILIGLQFESVLEALQDRSAGELIGWAAAVTGTVIGVRILWVMLVPGLGPYSRRERAVVAWSGMRGAIALAAALALPLDVPQRETLLFVTLAVIAVTLGLQGLTLPLLIRRLGVEERTRHGRACQGARALPHCRGRARHDRRPRVRRRHADAARRPRAGDVRRAGAPARRRVPLARGGRQRPRPGRLARAAAPTARGRARGAVRPDRRRHGADRGDPRGRA